MASDELIGRIQRIYASLGEVLEGDLSKFPPRVSTDGGHFSVYQDFTGGLNDAQIANLALGLVHNIANLNDHLRRWASQNGYHSKKIDEMLKTSESILIVMDLSNNDKHGYPPRDGGRSGKSPRLTEIGRVMRLTTGSTPGSSVGIFLTPSGIAKAGDGSANVVVTGQIVDSNHANIGDLHQTCCTAVGDWEQLCKDLGVLDESERRPTSDG